MHEAGGRQLLYTGVVHRPLPDEVEIKTTLSRGRWRIPYRVIGHTRALMLHDRIVARALPGLRDSDRRGPHLAACGPGDVEGRQRLGVPTVVERPNAHTRFAYQAVDDECKRLDSSSRPTRSTPTTSSACAGRSSNTNSGTICCARPSSSCRRSSTRASTPEKLLRHVYGYDPEIYHPATAPELTGRRSERAVRGRVRGAQGPPLRARSLAALTGLRDRHLQDRGGVPARLRRPAGRRCSRTPAWRCSATARTSPS